MLALLDLNKVFQVDCNASGSTIVAILNQEGKPIAYFREKLNNAKKKHYAYDQEFYAIVQALKKLRHYFFLKEFFLYTNH